MNQTKLAIEPVDAGRLVRDLLDALNSLKNASPPVCPVPPGDLTGPDSFIDEGESSLMSAFKRGEKSKAPEDQGEGRFERLKLVEEFRNDHELIERLQVTAEELDALSRVSLFGTLTGKRDLLFVLRQIREANETEASEAAAPAEGLQVLYQKIEPSIPAVSEMTEHIRREALAKLAETDSIEAASRQRGVFSSIKTMLNRRRNQQPQ
ncbi:MAG: hypothetical protein WBY93_07325 [Candidatus Binatus sp.]